MTIALRGTGVSSGVAIGKVHIVERNRVEVSEYQVAVVDLDSETQRFHNAITIARQQLRAIREHIPPGLAADISGFIDTHLLMLEDGAITQEPVRIIRERHCNAEWALKLQGDALSAVFDEMNDPYLRTRKDDVHHVVERVQRILLNHGPMRHELPDSRLRDYIIFADDLSPADTTMMEHHGIAAFATEFGGPTSHTAILARSLGIPAIVGLINAREYVRSEDLIVVDGRAGLVIIDPDADMLAYYRGRQDRRHRYIKGLARLKGLPARTQDGIDVKLYANVELPLEFESVKEAGAEGIGLYRTEFLYMNRSEPPTEEEQFEVYRQLIESMAPRPVTIRTLDLGADKQVDGHGNPLEANPALGLRAVRLCLKEPSLFRPQLRAIIRASVYGNVRLLIPMLSNLDEMYQVLGTIDNIRATFSNQGIAFDENMKIGGMIEVPAAALCADAFARHMDFLSLGTNDLIQYTMAIDRVNKDVNYLYDPLNPAVLRLISMTIKAGKRAGISVSMCGEMAGDEHFVRLLLAMGLNEFSVHPRVLLQVKRVIRSTSVDEIERLSQRLLRSHDARTRQSMLNRINANLEADMTD
ncbi:MAG: phosphoenolpyruvate--protein phosphotransferase [Gammaproteobacteria bacterium]|nr:phosphoenolpyruvate--protein phosphotransferase [Gammaproteobacteria bacterium]